jgi:hypothetical protein
LEVRRGERREESSIKARAFHFNSTKTRRKRVSDPITAPVAFHG